MRKTNIKNKLNLTRQTALFASIMLMVGTAAGVPISNAATLQEQINQLSADNSQKNQQVQLLKVEANGLQATISTLQSQIDGLQAQITENKAKSVELEKQIVAAQAELDEQKRILGENIKAMYLEGDISTIEMIASSNNLSDYFDKQQYRDVVETKIKNSLDKVTALKAQLKQQQEELTLLISQQTTLQQQVLVQKSEQDRLLGLNQQERSSLDSEMKSNFSKIAELRRQQIIANAKLGGAGITPGDPNHGGYPFDGTPFPNSVIDPWGMYRRQCVSYTAWKVYSTFGKMPYWGGHGNANQWDDNARADGIPTGSTPRVNSVAVWPVGFYGHVMWVEAVNDDGSIWISQYNYDFNGTYSEMRISASMAAGLTYIYFK